MPFSYIEGLLQSFGAPTIADDGGSSMAVACSEAHFGRMFAHLGGFFRLDAARKQAEALRTTQRQPIEEWSSATSIKMAEVEEGADAARRREGPKMSVKHAASATLSAAETAEVISAAAVVDDAPVRKKAATARKAETALSSSESVQAVNAVLAQRHTSTTMSEKDALELLRGFAAKDAAAATELARQRELVAVEEAEQQRAVAAAEAASHAEVVRMARQRNRAATIQHQATKEEQIPPSSLAASDLNLRQVLMAAGSVGVQSSPSDQAAHGEQEGLGARMSVGRVELEFVQKGPLGIKFTSDQNDGTAPVYVGSIVYGGLLDRLYGGTLSAGAELLAINGRAVGSQTLSQVRLPALVRSGSGGH
jgi:hypothetical protein